MGARMLQEDIREIRVEGWRKKAQNKEELKNAIENRKRRNQIRPVLVIILKERGEKKLAEQHQTSIRRYLAALTVQEEIENIFWNVQKQNLKVPKSAPFECFWGDF